MTHQPNNVSAAGEREAFEAACQKLASIPEEAHEKLFGNDDLDTWWALWKEARAAASAQATAPVGWFVQRSSFGPWIEVERYEDGAVRLHRMDGAQATGPAVQFTPSQLATLYMALGHFKSSGSVKCADSIMSIIKMDRG